MPRKISGPGSAISTLHELQPVLQRDLVDHALLTNFHTLQLPPSPRCNYLPYE